MSDAWDRYHRELINAAVKYDKTRNVGLMILEEIQTKAWEEYIDNITMAGREYEENLRKNGP